MWVSVSRQDLHAGFSSYEGNLGDSYLHQAVAVGAQDLVLKLLSSGALVASF